MTSSLDLVVRFSKLGDIILCSAFVKKLCQHKEAKIVFVTDPSFAEVVGTFGARPDTVWAPGARALSLCLQTYQYLQNAHGQSPLSGLRVFDLHNVPKSLAVRTAAFLFCLVHKVPYRSFKSPKRSLLRWLLLITKIDLLGRRFIYREHQKLLSPHNEFFLPELRKPDAERAPEVLSILVAPDSLHWKKRWIVNHWEAFFDLAFKEFPHVEFTLVGSPNCLPRDLVDQLSETYKGQVKNRLGFLPLTDLARVASEHRLTLCGNSAWQHVSESVGVPVISLPGPIVPAFGFSPFLPQSRELGVTLSCRPCTRHGGGACHRIGDDFHACMKQVSPEMLLQNIKELLS